MKIHVLLFLVAVVVLTAAEADTQMAVVARLQTASLNALIETVKTQTLPKLITELNAQGTIREGDVEIRGFALDSANLEVGVDTSSTGSTQSARLAINVQNFDLNVATVNYKVFDGWLGSCTARFSARLKIPRLTIGFLIDIPSAGIGNDIRLSLADVDVSSIDVDLDSNGGGICGGGLSWILAGVVDVFDSRFDDIVESKLQEEFTAVSANTIVLTEQLGFPIEEDDTVVGFITPSVQVGQVFTTSTAISLGMTTSLSAELASPDWRSGRSYKPLISSNLIALPEEDFDAHVLISFDTINALLATVWYVGWAVISDDPASQESSLCESTDRDPCTFPPFLETIDAFSLENWILKAAFLPSYGFVRDFTIEAVVDPPILGFADNKLSGTGSGKLLVRGSGWKLDNDNEMLAVFDVGIFVEASAPVFDQENGKLTSFRIQNFDISTLSVDIFNDNIRGMFFEFRMNRLFSWVARTLGNVVDLFLDKVNTELEQSLERTSLEIPPIENFPVQSQTTSFRMANTLVRGTSLNNASFLEVASDVVVSVA